MPKIGKLLEMQFARMWEMLREASFNTSEDTWREGFRTTRGLACLAYHIVETVDFYISNTESDFSFGKRLGGNIWEAVMPLELPSKEQVQEYAEGVRKKTEDLLASLADSKFLGSQKIFHWTGETLLERFIYMLKHCYYHMGHMNRVIRLKGNIPIDWR